MRITKRFLLSAALIAGALLGRASAQTVMFPGQAVAITGITNATPPVVSFASGALGATTAGDVVYVKGVGTSSSAQPNGVWPCSAVSATSCTLSGPSANGVFAAGGTIQLLGAVSNGTGAVFDVSPCMKSSVYIYSNGASSAIVALEGTSSPANGIFIDPKTGALSPVPATPWSTLASVTNPDSGAAGNGFYTPATNVNWLRVTISNWVSGTMYPVLTCQKSDGTRVW